MHVPNLIRMMVMMIAVVGLPFNLMAQNITTEAKEAAIKTIASHIAANYVSAEKGGQIASHILTAANRGDFLATSTWEEFNSAVTKSLQEFSKDEHLYVRFDPSEAKRLKNDAGKSDRMYIGSEGEAAGNTGISESKVMEGNIGYLRLASIDFDNITLSELSAAMDNLANTDGMIIDLRDNAGSNVDGGILESYFLPAGTPLLEYFSRNGWIKTDSTKNLTSGQRYEKPLYVIINNKTASAAEALAFVLQQNRRAKIVGQRSAGAAYMNQWFAVNDENYMSVSTSSPALPNTEINWQGTGVQPDIKIKKGDPIQIVMEKLRK